MSAILSLVLGIVLFVCGLYGGYAYEARKFVSYQSQVEAAGQAAEEKSRAETANREQITKGISNDYQKKLAAIKSAYSRLQYSPTSSSPMPSVPEATARIDVPAPDTQLTESCTETTQQLVSLQDWVNSQYSLGK